MLLLNFLVGPSTHMKNLGYRSNVASLSSLISLLPFASKHNFYRVPIVCMLSAQLLRNGQCCTKYLNTNLNRL